jgi:hypothetical protein
MGLARFDAFVKVKCIFFTTPEAENFSKSSWIETEANAGHCSDRTRSQHDRTRPVSGSSSQARDARALHQRVRLVTGPVRPVKP